MVMGGCGKDKSAGNEEDLAITFAAYQFAKSEIQVLMPIPNSAVFPQISGGSVAIEELDSVIEIKSHVSFRELPQGDLLSKDFIIVLTHLGDGQFQTESIIFE
jgi:hypothetical protein